MTTTTATTAPIALPLEAKDLRALRSADSIVFRLSRGQATIEANRDGRNTPDGFDAKATIYAGGELVTDYTRYGDGDGYAMGNRRNGGDGYTAFHMEHSGPRFDLDLATLISRLAVGNTVGLQWTRGNDSPVTTGAGFHRDELRLTVDKPGAANGGRGRRESYLVAVLVGPDNTARMVRAN